MSKLANYDLRRHWTRRIAPHLADDRLNAVLVRDFHMYTWGRFGKPFRPGMSPRDFEGCGWHLGHRGPAPRYWRYVKYGACHWVVNFALRLATLAEPGRPWRILTSHQHSTVWDGGGLLFDFNYQAFGIAPGVCFARARQGQELAVGKYRKVYYAESWQAECRRKSREQRQAG